MAAGASPCRDRLRLRRRHPHDRRHPLPLSPASRRHRRDRHHARPSSLAGCRHSRDRHHPHDCRNPRDDDHLRDRHPRPPCRGSSPSTPAPPGSSDRCPRMTTRSGTRWSRHGAYGSTAVRRPETPHADAAGPLSTLPATSAARRFRAEKKPPRGGTPEADLRVFYNRVRLRRLARCFRTPRRLPRAPSQAIRVWPRCGPAGLPKERSESHPCRTIARPRPPPAADRSRDQSRPSRAGGEGRIREVEGAGIRLGRYAPVLVVRSVIRHARKLTFHRWSRAAWSRGLRAIRFLEATGPERKQHTP